MSQAKRGQYFLKTDECAVVFAVEASNKKRRAEYKRIDVFSKDTLNQSFAGEPRTLRFSFWRRLHNILPH